jgi:eukaryotic-like serine/threonine-protein kinase
VIGTAAYLSPEQACGEPVDAGSDIYSTGCLLNELLTGRPPFIGDSPMPVVCQHVQETPRPPSTLNPQLPPVADAITLTALQKNPRDRYRPQGRYATTSNVP